MSIRMIDVSEFQTGLDIDWWRKAYEDGYRVAAIRIWDGHSEDESWNIHRAYAKSAGFKVYPYCDAPLPTVSPVDAGVTVRQLVDKVSWDTILFVDWEPAGGYSRFDETVWSKFCAGYQKAPGIYCSQDYSVPAKIVPLPPMQWVASWDTLEVPHTTGDIETLAAWQTGPKILNGVNVDEGEWMDEKAFVVEPAPDRPPKSPIDPPVSDTTNPSLAEIVKKLDNHWDKLVEIDTRVKALEAVESSNRSDEAPASVSAVDSTSVSANAPVEVIPPTISEASENDSQDGDSGEEVSEPQLVIPSTEE